MSTSTITLGELAGEAYKHFQRKERDNGEAFYSLDDSAPDWLHDLVREAHGEMLPDDWRYNAIHSVLGQLHDYGTEDETDAQDHASEICDGLVDTYNANRSKWLASHISRAGYVDEGVDEIGGEGLDTFQRLGLGQYMEIQEILASVVESLKAEMDERAER